MTTRGQVTSWFALSVLVAGVCASIIFGGWNYAVIGAGSCLLSLFTLLLGSPRIECPYCGWRAGDKPKHG